MVSDRPAPLRVLALGALGRRRRLQVAEAAAASEDADPRVVLAATRAMGLSSGPVDAQALGRLLRHADPEISRAAMVSALELRCRLGGERARELTATGKGDAGGAALYLAIAGETDAWELLEAAARGRSPVVLEALGWFGCLRAMEIMIDALAKGDEEAAGAASGALYRLTGAPLTDDFTEDDRAEVLPLGGAFAAPERGAELTKKPEIWSAWWERRRRQADPLRRHRFGHLWSVEDNLWELADALSAAQDRQLALLELRARAGADAPLDLEDFVTRQHQHIGELRAQTARAAARAGEWPTRLNR
jgi:hypothetical protein